MPPRSGPIQYAVCPSKMCVTTAGPNERAGFIDPPVSGPIARMPAVTVRPIANPPTFGPRGIHRRAEHHEHEEERRDRLERDRLDQR